MNELFTFVEFPEVPDDNNAAERAIRPAVIIRKVCGGTRSEQGTNVKAALMSAQARSTSSTSRRLMLLITASAWPSNAWPLRRTVT